MSRKRAHLTDEDLSFANIKAGSRNKPCRDFKSAKKPSGGVPPQINIEQEQSSGTFSISPSKKTFDCEYCGKQYQRTANLRKHLDDCEKFKIKNCVDTVTANLEKVIAEKDNEIKNGKAKLLKFQNLYFLDKSGQPKLFQAVESNDKYLVQELIDNGADVNVRESSMEIPINRASVALTKDLSARIRIIGKLLRSEADPFARHKWGHTFLHRTVEHLTPNQFREVVTCLLENNLAKLFGTPDGMNGATPLQLAVRQMEVTSRTLADLHRANVNFKIVDTRYGQSLLAYAVEGKGTTTLLSNLIAFGANPKHLNLERQNILHIAAQRHHDEAIKFFLGKGLDINAVDRNGNTPLHLAMQCKMNNLLRTVQLLISKGADSTFRNREVRTPLHMAAMDVAPGIIVEVIKLLVESDKTIMRNAFAKDQHRHTFLDYLARKRCKLSPDQFGEIVEFLVGMGLDKLFHIRNKVVGQTPLEMAVRNIDVRKDTLALLNPNHTVQIKVE